jgi:hypothetical protein
MMIPAPTAPELQQPQAGASSTPTPIPTIAADAAPSPQQLLATPPAPKAPGSGHAAACSRAHAALTAVLLAWCVVATFMAACDWKELLLLNPDALH